LFDEDKACLFIKMSRRVKALKGPQVHALVAFAATKVDRGGEETIADASTAYDIGHDEPPEMGALVFGMEAVDCNGRFHAILYHCYPEAVTPFVISTEELSELSGHLRLEERPEAPFPVVVATVQFSHAAERSRDIASPYLDVRHMRGPDLLAVGRRLTPYPPPPSREEPVW
jgi:hypothetical protein